jgi:hypothetical protein
MKQRAEKAAIPGPAAGHIGQCEPDSEDCGLKDKKILISVKALCYKL